MSCESPSCPNVGSIGEAQVFAEQRLLQELEALKLVRDAYLVFT